MKRAIVLVVVSVLILPALAIVDPGEKHTGWRDGVRLDARLEPIPAGARGPAGEVARSFRLNEGGAWSFYRDPRTDRLALAVGSGVALYPGKGNDLQPADRAVGTPVDLESVRPRLEAFMARNPGLQPPAGELLLDEALSSIRDRGRLGSFYYQWTVGGVPVDGARVFVRANSGNIVQFGSEKIAEIDIATQPTLDAAAAFLILRTHGDHEESGRLVEDARLMIQPEPAGSKLGYRLVWEMRYRTPGGLETWEGRVDAHTGEVVKFVDGNHYVRATGGVYPRSVLFADETVAPFSLVNVDVAGAPIATSPGATFGYSGGGVSSTMSGPWFDVDCQECTSPAQPLFETTVGSGRVDFGFGDTQEVGNGVSTSADRNVLYHALYARQIGLKWLPAEEFFAAPDFGIRTNIDAACNATFDGQNINFFRENGSCNNTGNVADVVYHEYGHGVDLNTLGGSGGTGEGSADANSIQVSHSAQIGPGFRLSGGPVRDLDSTTSARGVFTYQLSQQICGGSVHCQGEVLGQAVWDLSQALVAKYGYHTGWRESERLFYLSLPDQGEINPDDPNAIFLAYVMADDDNGDLNDGTPHGEEIFTAFNTHGMAPTNFGDAAECTRPAQPVASAVSSCDAIDLSWTAVGGIDRYEIFRTELFAERAFVPLTTMASDQTSFIDTDVVPGVDYYYQVMAVATDGCESTVESPAMGRLDSQPIISIDAIVVDDTPRGNRSGFPDPGEEVDVFLTVGNFGEIAADGLAGTVVSTTPGVTLLVDSPSFSAVPAGGSSGGASIRFVADSELVPCGTTVDFQYLPDEASGCAADTSYFSVTLGEPDGLGGFVCDPTPACFTPATFSGLDAVAPGGSCAETQLSWGDASSNCINAEVTYNVYRGTSPVFPLDGTTRIAEGVVGTAFGDQLLQPGEVYYYAVRAFDSRSGEETNEIIRSVVAPSDPDTGAPVFAGLVSAQSGTTCGETVLSWGQGLETCSGPVSYEVYRSLDPAFTPTPENRIGSSLSTQFTDQALTPGDGYTYVVRARDALGNETSGDARLTVDAGILDDVRGASTFEIDGAGWAVVAPNDASRGNWEVGDPEASASQPEDDFTVDGTDCWVTGAPAFLNDGNNNDIDGGTTTLLSASYDLTDVVDPAVSYARWFSNSQGASPGEDELIVEVSSDDGVTWTELERVIEDSGEWETVDYPLNGVITPTNKTRFRFTAADLGSGSLVDAAIDDFRLFDREQGCLDCTLPVDTVGNIQLFVVGDDIILNWTNDPVDETRYVVYLLSGQGFGDAIRIGTTATNSFLHEGALNALSADFYYRVSAIDECGNESDLE